MDYTPEGVLHMLGNVAEWTDSAFFAVVHGEFKPNYYQRIIKGGDWGRQPSEWMLSDYFVNSVDGNLINLGFRCAKSVQP